MALLVPSHRTFCERHAIGIKVKWLIHPLTDHVGDMSGRGYKAMSGNCCSSYRKLHFSDPGTHCRVRTKVVVEGVPLKTDAEWTERMRHGKTAVPQTDHFNSTMGVHLKGSDLNSLALWARHSGRCQ